jgi:hypothetical protein
MSPSGSLDPDASNVTLWPTDAFCGLTVNDATGGDGVGGGGPGGGAEAAHGSPAPSPVKCLSKVPLHVPDALPAV